jgi:hypothetical protein
MTDDIARIASEIPNLHCSECAERGIEFERAAIVAWMRVNGTGHLADCIERGDHHHGSAGK